MRWWSAATPWPRTFPSRTGISLAFPFSAAGVVQILGNSVTGMTGDGIYAFGPAIVSGNTLTNDAIGIEMASNGQATGNTVTGSKTYGVETDGANGTTGTIRGNTISDSAIGGYAGGGGVFQNNLFLDNTAIGFENYSVTTFINNTIVQVGRDRRR